MTESTEDEGEREVPGDGGFGWVFFAAVVPCGAIFVVTILAMIAAALGDPASPISRFFDGYGTTILVVEACATIVAALVAMAVDRVLTRRAAESEENPTPASGDS